MSGFLLELKLAMRGLRRRPWVAAAAVGSLALGFAAQIVVLSCANAVLWKPLAVPEPDRVVTIYGHSEMIGSLTNIAHPQVKRLGTLDVFEGVAAFTRLHLVWETGQSAEKIGFEMVSENYFEVVQPPLELGRPPREAGEILLGYDFWRDRFGADRDAVGKTVRLTGQPYVISGVMGREYRGSLLDYIGNPKAWISVRSQSLLPFPFLEGIDLRESWVFNWFVGVGRLRPGITAEQAQLAVAAYEQRNPPPANATLRDTRVFAAERANFHPEHRERVERTLALTVGLAGLLLLLGCLNASLFLVGKALDETRQAAMERALGAGAFRIVRRRFVEAILLCGAAVTAGSACAAWWIQLLAAYPPPLAFIVFRPSWDWRVWSLTAGWIVLAVVVAGLAPAFVTTRAATVQAVYSGPSRSARRLREALVALQVAVAAAILIASGFVLRTIVAAHAIGLGFVPDGLVMAEVEFNAQGADTKKRAEVVRQSVAQLQQRPEIEQSAAALFMPLTVFRKPGLFRDASGMSRYVFSNLVSPSYFETLRLGLDRGRPFAAGTRETVVNQTLAGQFAPRGDVLGRTLEVLDEEGELRQRLTIVGVARNAKYHTLWQQDIPYFYVSADDDPGGSPAIIVRSRASVETTWQAIRETVQGAYPQAIVSSPSTVNSQMAELIREHSYLAAFFGALGGIALLVAAGGLMANLYLMVSQRTREIGIRQALGASRAVVLRVVLRQGLLVAGGGLLLGLAVGNRLEQWIRPLAPGTPEGDPWPLALTFATLLLAAIAASLGPALRAARIEPWKAIRHSE